MLAISHESGDGERGFSNLETGLNISYVLPSPLDQLGTLDEPRNCSLSLLVEYGETPPFDRDNPQQPPPFDRPPGRGPCQDSHGAIMRAAWDAYSPR